MLLTIKAYNNCQKNVVRLCSLFINTHRGWSSGLFFFLSFAQSFYRSKTIFYNNILTCLPCMTITRAAPAAVSAHVRSVPRRAWTTGGYPLIIFNRRLGLYPWHTRHRQRRTKWHCKAFKTENTMLRREPREEANRISPLAGENPIILSLLTLLMPFFLNIIFI